MPNLSELRKELKRLKDPKKEKILSSFFKTGKGEYAEGDIFYGIKVPDTRKTIKKYMDLSLPDLEDLLHSPIHEERLAALLILVAQFKNGDQHLKQTVYKLYMANTTFINNWDLVDLTAEHIIGAYLDDNDKSILETLAISDSLWERRIAMLSCFHYIKKGRPQEALRIAHILKNDDHDLIQKAVGWMLREIGKRCSIEIEENYLKKHYKTMPRTMLRYAIERFPEEKRLNYLKGKI